MKLKVVGIGEVLWDVLPTGRQLGGAPANFAYHAGALGAEARVISRVGNDADGREILEQLRNLGVPTDCIEVDGALPTGTVSVELAADGQPRYCIHEGVAWDAIAGEPAGRSAVASADAVCFGALAQRSEASRRSIRALVRAAPPAALRILDVNLRQHYFSQALIEESLALSNVLKVNDAEWPLLAGMFALGGDERAQISELADRFALRAVALTRGSRGSLLWRDRGWSDHPGMAAQVADTVGAGDAFTAAMTLGLLAGWDLDAINQEANEVAAFVCSRAGATPPLPARLREPFHALQSR